MGDALSSRLPRAVLAFDRGPEVGLGHLRRMEALGVALSEAGVASELVVTDAAVEGDLVVVDSYRYRADDARRFRGRVVAALDDLDRDLAVDVVIDPSPGSTATPHHRAGRVLAGPDYALIDPALMDVRPRPVGDEVATVLVSMGGGDGGSGATVAAGLSSRLLGVAVRLAVGPWSAAEPPSGVEVVRTLEGLGPELARADLVVTAGGVTLLEALRLGRPTVAVAVAENQRRAVTTAGQLGAVVVATPEEAVDAAVALAGDAARRKKLANAAVVLVDGLGSSRVAAALMDALGR